MLLSDFHINIPHWTEYVEHFHKEMCCSKLTYSNDKSLFSSGEKDSSESDDFVPRGNSFLYIYHHLETELANVGLQLWNSSIVMADWIIKCRDIFVGMNIIELGSGVGFLSALLSFYAKNVYVTDYNPEVLQLCEFNVKFNNIPNVKVKLLDWNYSLHYNFQTTNISENKFCLGKSDEEVFFGQVDLIIASDVIYDEDLTEAFLRTIYELILMNKTCKVIIFVQKRIICSYENEECAPFYDHFVGCLDDLNNYPVEDSSLVFNVKSINLENLDQFVQYEVRPSNVHAFQVSLLDKSVSNAEVEI